MAEPRKHVWEGSFFRHEGIIHWECSLCRKSGLGSFKLASTREVPTRDDYDEVLSLAEAEHALRCGGSLSFESAHRGRYVEYSRADVGFGRDGSVHLFVAAKERGEPGRYEELTIYEQRGEP